MILSASYLRNPVVGHRRPSESSVEQVACTQASRFRRRLSCCVCAVLSMGLSIAGTTPTALRCPEGSGEPYPAYAPISAPPSIAVWQDLTALPDGCRITLDAIAPQTVALAGRFTHAGSIDDIAARLGAISTTVGLLYWSVTDRDWKPLVTDATALDSPDVADRRADFDAEEILGGGTLYFAQNDSRSWGMNVYRLRVLDTPSDRLVVETDNVSGIKLGPLTLFAPHAVASVHFIEPLEGSTWAYFSLSVIRDGAFKVRKNSLINRQVALYRFLVGEAADAKPPLAP